MPGYLLAGGLYLVLSVGLWWHVWTNGSSAVMTCACTDAGRMVWYLEWSTFALTHGHSLLFSNWLFHPVGLQPAERHRCAGHRPGHVPGDPALRAGDRHQRGLDADPGPGRPVHVLAVAALGAMGAGGLRGWSGLRVLRLGDRAAGLRLAQPGLHGTAAADGRLLRRALHPTAGPPGSCRRRTGRPGDRRILREHRDGADRVGVGGVGHRPGGRLRRVPPPR